MHAEKADLELMEQTKKKNDIGVIIDDKLTFYQHITRKVNKAVILY